MRLLVRHIEEHYYGAPCQADSSTVISKSAIRGGRPVSENDMAAARRIANHAAVVHERTRCGTRVIEELYKAPSLTQPGTATVRKKSGISGSGTVLKKYLSAVRGSIYVLDHKKSVLFPNYL